MLVLLPVHAIRSVEAHDHVQWSAWVSVKAIVRFKLDQSFPVGESTSFEAMSEFSGLTVRNVRRLIRHAIAHHRFFQEKTPGIITHSAMTAILNRDALMRNSFIVEMDEFWSAGFSVGAPDLRNHSDHANETV